MPCGERLQALQVRHFFFERVVSFFRLFLKKVYDLILIVTCLFVISEIKHANPTVFTRPRK